MYSPDEGAARPAWKHSLPARLLAGTGLAGSLVLAALGQLSLLDRKFGRSAALYAGAVLLSAVLLRLIEGSRRGLPVVARPLEPGIRWRFLYLLPLAFALLGFAVWGVCTPQARLPVQRSLGPAWALSVVLGLVSVLGAVRWRPGSLRDLGERVRRNRLEIAGVGLLVLLAFALRTYDLTEHPYPFVNDEGAMGLDAVSILKGHHSNLFGTGYGSIPLIGFLPYCASIGVFGQSVLALRAVSALEGTLAILFIYALGRQVAGRAVGFLSAGFAAALPFHVHFSRLGVSNIVDGFMGPLVLGLTLRAIRNGRISDYVWAGLVTGSAVYVYLGSRLIIILVAGVLGWQVFRERRFLQTHWSRLLAFGATALFVATPMVVFFVKHPDIFMDRINSQSILHNGWLRDMMAQTGLPAWDLLKEQFWKTLGGFMVNPAIEGFFNSPRPYLFPVAAVFSVIGMGYAASRILQTGYLAVFVWFWSIIILGSTLMVNPPSSERLIQSVSPLSILFGLGVWKVAEGFSRLGLGSRLATVASAAVVLVAGLQGVRYYFHEYRSGGYFGNGADEAIIEVAKEARRLGSRYHLFLAGRPWVSVTYPNFAYLLPDIERSDIDQVASESVGTLARGRGAFFASLPGRADVLREIPLLVPGGEWKMVRRRYRSEPCYLGYAVAPEDLASHDPLPRHGEVSPGYSMDLDCLRRTMSRDPSVHYLVPALLVAMATGCGKQEAPAPSSAGGQGPDSAVANTSAPETPGAPRAGGAPPNVKERIEIDGAIVEVEHTAIDNGGIRDLFDGNRETLGRTENSTAMLVDLKFPTHRKTSGIEVTTGSMNVRLTVTLSVRGRGEPIVFQKTYTQLPPDPTVSLDLGGTHEVEKARIEIANADGGDGHVHVREVKFK